MRAVMITAPGDVSLREVSPPVRKTGEVLIRVRSMGICGSDIAAFKGINPLVSYPRIIGHEVAGTVIETSERSDPDVVPGDRVVLEPYVFCGRCYPCLNGRTNCCEQLQVRGVHVDGAMSELCSHPSRLVHKVPAGVPWERLAMVEPLTISIHAVKRVRAVGGERVVVTGAGPIGLLAALYAGVLGAIPIVVDPIDERLSSARALGIPFAVNPVSDDAVGRIREITDGRMAEAVIEASGSDAAIRSALDYVAYSGRVALVGWPKADVPLTTAMFTKKELDVVGSRNSRQAFPESIRLVSSGGVDVSALITRTVPFEAVPEAVREITAHPDRFMKVVALV